MHVAMLMVQFVFYICLRFFFFLSQVLIRRSAVSWKIEKLACQAGEEHLRHALFG
jgi:hypothetical protein